MNKRDWRLGVPALYRKYIIIIQERQNMRNNDVCTAGDMCLMPSSVSIGLGFSLCIYRLLPTTLSDLDFLCWLFLLERMFLTDLVKVGIPCDVTLFSTKQVRAVTLHASTMRNASVCNVSFFV